MGWYSGECWEPCLACLPGLPEHEKTSALLSALCCLANTAAAKAVAVCALVVVVALCDACVQIFVYLCGNGK